MKDKRKYFKYNKRQAYSKKKKFRAKNLYREKLTKI